MRVCIVGAGAIGGVLAACLARAGEDVTLVARGAQAKAIEANGLYVVYLDGREERIHSIRVAPIEDAGRFDVVILTVKAHQLAEIAPHVESLCELRTVVIPMQNGIPFWYFDGQSGPLANRPVQAVDPGGLIRTAIPARRIVGCVVFIAGERLGPGAVRHTGGDLLPIGELDGTRSERITKVEALFARGGFKAPILDDIRSEVWVKLWGNASFNPISALTRAGMATICSDPQGRELVARVMGEVKAVASKFGVTFRMTIEERIAQAARVGGTHKTSMLQDVEARRPLEIDALVGAVIELGEATGVPTPTARTLYEAVKLLDRSLRN